MRTPTPAPPLHDRVLTGHERRRQDRCWRPHGTEDWLLIHTLSGRVRVVVAERELLLGAGDTVLYRPGAEQDFGGDDSSASWEVVWAHFVPAPEWLELIRWPELAPGVLHMQTPESPLRERIEACLLEADRLAVSGLPRADRLALNALETALLWWDIHNPSRRRLDPRVVEAIEYLSHNLQRRVSVGELAQAVHLSPSRLAHLFSRETGTTPRRYAERQRLGRAQQLLEVTLLPVNEVARQAGFDDQFYFAARFKKLTGRTPSAFRSWRRSEDASGAAPSAN
jgi:AraC family transcriptional regulator, arabinose operon regulatory protein